MTNRLDTLGPHARARARHTLSTSADTEQLPPRPLCSIFLVANGRLFLLRGSVTLGFGHVKNLTTNYIRLWGPLISRSIVRSQPKMIGLLVTSALAFAPAATLGPRVATVARMTAPQMGVKGLVNSVKVRRHL